MNTRMMLAWALAGCFLGFSADGRSRGADAVAVRFESTDELLANPGQGWLSTRRLPCTVRYSRFNWMDLEPVEGQYDWKRMDDAIAAAAGRGARFAFRIMTTDAHTSGYYCSPKWLFDLRCKSYEYKRGGDDPTSGGAAIVRIEPDYADPLYLSKHRAFITALARRYDGHAGVEFVDIGSYGIWGEWHTSNAKPWAIRKQILDMYLDNFKKTPLLCMSDDAEALAWCIAHGAGFRRDGVGSDWHEKTWIGSKKYAAVEGFAEHWKKAPVCFEWFGDYKYIIGRGWSFDSAVEFMLKNHVTYINDNVGAVPPEQWPQIEKLARLVGYRLVLNEAVYLPSVKGGQVLSVQMKWTNAGVGKMYQRHLLTMYLLDEKGKIVCEQMQDEVDARNWLPGEQDVKATVKIPTSLAKGRYTLALALVDEKTGKPAIALACNAPHEARLYRIGPVAVE